MNSSEVIALFRHIGYTPDLRIITPLTDYISAMMKDDRILIIYDEGEPYAILFYSICDDYDPYFVKSDWAYLSHNPNGSTIYLEKIISKGWNKDLRKQFEESILNKFPQLQYAVWHKWASWGDRKVIAKRRLQYV